MPLPYPIPDPNRIKDPELRRVVKAICDNLRVICGETSDTQSAHTSRRDLIAAGIIAEKDGQIQKPAGG